MCLWLTAVVSAIMGSYRLSLQKCACSLLRAAVEDSVGSHEMWSYIICYYKQGNWIRCCTAQTAQEM